MKFLVEIISEYFNKYSESSFQMNEEGEKTKFKMTDTLVIDSLIHGNNRASIPFKYSNGALTSFINTENYQKLKQGINPETGRKIKINGPTFNRIIEKYYTMEVEFYHIKKTFTFIELEEIRKGIKNIDEYLKVNMEFERFLFEQDRLIQVSKRIIEEKAKADDMDDEEPEEPQSIKNKGLKKDNKKDNKEKNLKHNIMPLQSKRLIKKPFSELGQTAKKNLRNLYNTKTIKEAVKKAKEENNFSTDEEAQKFIIYKYNSIINDKKKAVKLNKQKEAFKKVIISRLNKEPSKDKKFLRMNENKLMTLVEVLLSNKFRKYQYILTIGNKSWTLTNELLIKLRLFIDAYEVLEEGTGSDADITARINDISTVKIRRLPPKINQKKFKGGKFFIYEHLLNNVDLTELQIYEKDTFKAEYYEDNCFVKSLKGQLPEETINSIKLDCPGKHISMKHIKQISEKYKIHFIVSDFCKCDNVKRLKHYGKDNQIKVEICLLEEHYFKFCKVPITRYAFDNIDDIKHLPKWNEIIRLKENGKYKRDCSKFMNSFSCVKALLDNKEKYLIEISKDNEIYKTPFYNNVKKIDSLYYDNEINTELNEYKPKESKNIRLVFFDFETKTKGIHEPYMVHIKSEEVNKTFYGSDCALSMLRYISKYFKESEVKLVAHNLAYDFKFISKHLAGINGMIQRGNSIMSAEGFFNNCRTKNIKIKFQDSYALIPNKLSAFGKMFGLEQQKEFIPYNLYNVEDFILPLDIKVVKTHCDYQVNCNNIGKKITKEMYQEAFEILLSNAVKWGCVKDNKIDMLKYSQCYCELDCIILEKGYFKFKKDIMDICGLDIDNYISVASIANEYMLKEGVYNDVYKLNAVPREFIQLCVVGGRTMCSENKKIHVSGKKLDDFDAVSLYPSAMKRLKGLLKGKPKVLETTDYNTIKNYDGYFVEVKINKVNIHRDFPLLSYVNDNGVRMFSNDMEGRTVYLDKISLEDAIEYQHIEFDIIRGYYYNEGRNNKLEEVISYMFEQRLRYKALKNPIQNIFKLLMNSSYGKSILKPIEDNLTILRGKEKAEACIMADYQMIKEITTVNDIYLIKKHKSIIDHFNNAPAGVEVLSMSKRIMNEVICTAEDNKLKIYYQDTDSMHIQTEDVMKLSSIYKDKYNRVLIGKGMGQFHTDFDSDILKGNIYAKESYFLGKKCYIDVLTDESGKEDYHIRMKGVSSVAILDKAEKEHDFNILEIYKNLYEGMSYSFDLTCSNKKACFNHDNIAQISSKSDFSRTINF